MPLLPHDTEEEEEKEEGYGEREVDARVQQRGILHRSAESAVVVMTSTLGPATTQRHPCAVRYYVFRGKRAILQIGKFESRNQLEKSLVYTREAIMAPSVPAAKPPGFAGPSSVVQDLQGRIEDIMAAMRDAATTQDYAGALTLQAQLPPLREQLKAELAKEIERAEAAANAERARLAAERAEERERAKLSHAKKPAINLDTKKASSSDAAAASNRGGPSSHRGGPRRTARTGKPQRRASPPPKKPRRQLQRLQPSAVAAAAATRSPSRRRRPRGAIRLSNASWRRRRAVHQRPRQDHRHQAGPQPRRQEADEPEPLISHRGGPKAARGSKAQESHRGHGKEKEPPVPRPPPVKGPTSPAPAPAAALPRARAAWSEAASSSEGLQEVIESAPSAARAPATTTVIAAPAPVPSAPVPAAASASNDAWYQGGLNMLERAINYDIDGDGTIGGVAPTAAAVVTTPAAVAPTPAPTAIAPMTAPVPAPAVSLATAEATWATLQSSLPVLADLPAVAPLRPSSSPPKRDRSAVLAYLHSSKLTSSPPDSSSKTTPPKQKGHKPGHVPAYVLAHRDKSPPKEEVEIDLNPSVMSITPSKSKPPPSSMFLPANITMYMPPTLLTAAGNHMEEAGVVPPNTMMLALKTLIIRDSVELDSTEVGKVVAGTPLTVLETRDMKDGSKRACILYERLQRLYRTETAGVHGWVTLVSKDGTMNLQELPRGSAMARQGPQPTNPVVPASIRVQARSSLSPPHGRPKVAAAPSAAMRAIMGRMSQALEGMGQQQHAQQQQRKEVTPPKSREATPPKRATKKDEQQAEQPTPKIPEEKKAESPTAKSPSPQPQSSPLPKDGTSADATVLCAGADGCIYRAGIVRRAAGGRAGGCFLAQITKEVAYQGGGSAGGRCGRRREEGAALRVARANRGEAIRVAAKGTSRVAIAACLVVSTRGRSFRGAGAAGARPSYVSGDCDQAADDAR